MNFFLKLNESGVEDKCIVLKDIIKLHFEKEEFKLYSVLLTSNLEEIKSVGSQFQELIMKLSEDIDTIFKEISFNKHIINTELKER